MKSDIDKLSLLQGITEAENHLLTIILPEIIMCKVRKLVRNIPDSPNLVYKELGEISAYFNLEHEISKIKASLPSKEDMYG